MIINTNTLCMNIICTTFKILEGNERTVQKIEEKLCGVWCVVCGVWCVVCGVWCVMCWKISKIFFHNFREKYLKEDAKYIK